jgi:hypothetical protein
MSPASTRPPQLGGTSLPHGSDAPDVKWTPPVASAHRAPRALYSANLPPGGRTERVNALTVTILTLACTVLAIFDLFLLASGG